MFIDYSKIVTEDLRLYVNATQLAELKDVASKERTYLNNRYHKDTLRTILARKAEETVYVNARHQTRNNIEKAIIASEIVFDSQKFAETLLNCEFDINTLQTYIKLLNYLKAKVANDDIDQNDEKYLVIADNFAKRLVKHFIKFNGVSSQNIIINKINEILSFEPELLDTEGKKNSRK